jgi:integrase/recombinase XerD
MKKLVLKNSSYEYLQISFKEWLDILGYNPMSVYNLPNIIREFLHFLESKNINHINHLEQNHYKDYYSYIYNRGNQRRGGGLSNNYINKHLQAIEKFLQYLHHKGMRNVPHLGITLLKLNTKEITVLSQDEIQLFYKSTYREVEFKKQEAMQARDRVLLTVFYGCGLRRREGASLELNDINLDRRVLHVRKGKNYKERFVPFSKPNTKILEEYIYDFRPLLAKSKMESRLFIGWSGKPLGGGGLYTRLKLLQLQIDDILLQNKTIGLHTLRHSIATHLLEAGMPLDKISRFLGHSSLESTQIYTHLVRKPDS